MQILKLGLAGAEQTLPTKSRVNNQGTPRQIYQQSESINGSLNTYFVGIKEGWSISWDILSKEDEAFLTAIVNLQYTTGNKLNFIYTDEDGTEFTKTVFAEISGIGSLIQRDIFLSSGYGLELREC